MKKGPKATPCLAAVMIARNEARCIARAITSLKPWVDRIVVVDTGSQDGTPAIAAAAGAGVHHLVWPDNFAAARNFALECADADWNLIIDADEWLVAGGEGVREWCEQGTRLGRVCIHSDDDSTETQTTTRNWITRLLPRGVRYEGRVHEQPMSRLPVARTPIQVRHDGYLAAQREHKRARNRPLLLAELLDRPGDGYLCYQLGKESAGDEDFVEACQWYEKALAATSPTDTWHRELVTSALHAFGRAGRFEDAIVLASGIEATMTGSPDFYFVLGNLFLDRAVADPHSAVTDWLPLCLKAWRQCLAIGERPDLEGSVEGRGSHLARFNIDLVERELRTLATINS